MGHRRRMRRRRRAHRTHVRWIIDAAFINIFNLFIFILLRSILVFGLFTLQYLLCVVSRSKLTIAPAEPGGT
jgi:hypothetical protein